MALMPLEQRHPLSVRERGVEVGRHVVGQEGADVVEADRPRGEPAQFDRGQEVVELLRGIVEALSVPLDEHRGDREVHRQEVQGQLDTEAPLLHRPAAVDEIGDVPEAFDVDGSVVQLQENAVDLEERLRRVVVEPEAQA